MQQPDMPEQLSSEATLPSSSPICNSRLSDTPPSSPPTFPWESERASQCNTSSTTRSEQPVKSALSVLGKRKAVLAPASHNVRPTKRINSYPKSKTSPWTQMQLSLGQKVEKKCDDCGMVYVVSSAEDRKLHDKFHVVLHHGCEVGKDFAKRSSQGVFTVAKDQVKTIKDDSICVVTRDDQKWKRKYARDVLDVITTSLGACAIPDDELLADLPGSYEMYLYIREGRCVSAVVTETLRHKVRRVIRPVDKRASVGATKMTTLERLRARQEADRAQEKLPLVVSEERHEARIGISRIWTAPACRGQNLASTLLDLIYEQRICNTKETCLSKSATIAFSQPTEAGTRLARKWLGQQYNWLVY